MEKELEVKLINIDLEEFKNSLLKKGASLTHHEKQENILISSKTANIICDRDYMRIRLVKDLLNNKSYNYLTYKKMVEDSEFKRAEEYTIEFDNLSNLKKILEFIKLDDFESTFKERFSYSYKNIRIDFDYWDRNSFPFDYAEIEANSEEELNKFLDEFSISRENISSKSIKELREEYKGI
ncbi:class IV adenylate cyclase [Lagierella sp. ICN-221743]